MSLEVVNTGDCGSGISGSGTIGGDVNTREGRTATETHTRGGGESITEYSNTLIKIIEGKPIRRTTPVLAECSSHSGSSDGHDCRMQQ